MPPTDEAAGAVPGCFAEPVEDGYVPLLVVGDTVVGSLPEVSPTACRRLARSNDTSILELRFSKLTRSTRWVFVDAMPLPTITASGQAGLVARWLDAAARVPSSRGDGE